MQVAVEADLTVLRETHGVCPHSLYHQPSMALWVDHATSFILVQSLSNVDSEHYTSISFILLAPGRPSYG